MEYKFEKPVHGTIQKTKYQCTIEWRNGKFIGDEPVDNGGKDEGPDPFTLLLSSLASCTLITLRMYIDRKGWDIPTISVNTNMYTAQKDGKPLTVIDRDIRFDDSITNEQRERLTEIAKACPISKVLEGNVVVRTYAYYPEKLTKEMKYSNGEVTVLWRPDVCKHSGRCVTQLHSVFNAQAHPWINMQGASTQQIIDQVNKCPTGAISIQKNSAEKQ